MGKHCDRSWLCVGILMIVSKNTMRRKIRNPIKNRGVINKALGKARAAIFLFLKTNY